MRSNLRSCQFRSSGHLHCRRRTPHATRPGLTARDGKAQTACPLTYRIHMQLPSQFETRAVLTARDVETCVPLSHTCKSSGLGDKLTTKPRHAHQLSKRTTSLWLCFHTDERGAFPYGTPGGGSFGISTACKAWALVSHPVFARQMVAIKWITAPTLARQTSTPLIRVDSSHLKDWVAASLQSLEGMMAAGKKGEKTTSAKTMSEIATSGSRLLTKNWVVASSR